MSKHRYRHHPNPPLQVPTRPITLALLTGLELALVPGVAAADEIRDGQWYLETLGITEAHQLSQGAGVTIGVIDTGIDATHSDLAGQIIGGTDLVYSNRDGTTDTYGHGTSVASVLVGKSKPDGVLGIAPAAKVLSVNIFEDGAETTDPSLMAPAIEWLIDNGADVISISLGGGGDRASQQAINRAIENGIPIVASAGNRYQDIGFGQEERSGISMPAGQKGTIPVTALDTNGEFWKDSLDLSLAQPQPRLGLVAPGVDIPIALPNNQHDTKNGTSLSAPIVAGTLALIKSAYPDLDYQTLIARLIETVQDRGPEGYDDKYGWGIVNPLAALTEDVVFHDDYSSIESYADDRLPLDEQGQQSDEPTEPNGDQDPSGESSDDQALTSSDTGNPLWIPIAIAAAALLAAAIILTLILRKKRHRTNTTPPNPQPSRTAIPVTTTPITTHRTTTGNQRRHVQTQLHKSRSNQTHP